MIVHETHDMNLILPSRKMHGDRCISCGSNRDIVWHFIVPVGNGVGEEVFTNVVPLCQEHHKAVLEYHGWV